MASEIQVYGTDWCGLTFNLREYLTNTRMAYDFRDIDRDPDACEEMLGLTDGQRRFPVVVVSDSVLANPSRAELQRALDENRIRPSAGTRRPDLVPVAMPSRRSRG